MPAFSRLQLAQALLEYDNQDLPPEAPQRSAYDSAIFAHLRRARGPPRPTTTVYRDEAPRRSRNHLGVELPHDGEAAETELGSGFRGSVGARRSLDIQSALPTRKSVDVLRSDWGDKRASRFETSELGYLGTPDEDEDAPEGGMDLSSWGLDKASRFDIILSSPSKNHDLVYVAKPDQEKQASKARQGTSDRRVSIMSRSPSDALPNPFARMPTPADNVSTPPERPKHAHRHSDFGAGGAFLDAQRSQDSLIHDALKDRPRSVANPLDLAEYRAHGPHIPLEKRRQSVGALPSEALPFPSTTSPAPLADNNDEDLPNPFALPPPTPDRLSRFDPKAQHSLSQVHLHEGEGDALSMRTGTMREGNAHIRTYSNASLGSRALLDDFKDDGASYMTGRQLDAAGNKPVSRMELLRPKVLVMPSPLQGSQPQPNQNAGRAGFMLSSDGTPLPPGATPGARPGVRPLTGMGTSHSNQSVVAGFTPNPRATMSLSQLTFRNNLVVDGSRDVAYNDIDQQLRRATAEGEQVEQLWDDYDAETEAPQADRPAGRLYGRSLMDDLQDRKAQIHGRQRVFRGDNRPAMMDRGQIRTQSTLIDPTTLQPRPVTVFPHGPIVANTEERPNLKRSSTIQPLLNFGSDEPGRAANSKSVFGVDTLWEKEMARLRETQEQQRLAAEAQRADEEAKQRRKLKKGKKGKGKNEAPVPSPTAASATEPPNVSDLNRLSSAPPTLPNITPLNEQAPPASPGESESSLPAANRRRRSVATLDAGGWFAGSSDGEEESGEKRESGPRVLPVSGGRDEDSDDDVPLTNIKVRAPESDDEDAPLSNLKPRQSVLLPDLKSASTMDIAASLGLAPEPTQTKAAKDDDSDDEVPLAIRRQTIMLPQGSDNKPAAGNDDSDDDEKPLGLRLSQAPNIAQQRRQTEYQQMMLMQQQQQQLMMQQQAMHASMFNASMLSFQPHMGGPGSVHSFGTPMPIQDPKLTRVDQWRHDVSGVNDS